MAVILLSGCPSSTVDPSPMRPDASKFADAATTVNDDAAATFDDAAATFDDAASPDAAEMLPPDSGSPIDSGFKIRSANLTPAGGAATGANNTLQGKLSASGPTVATSTTHQIRGGLGPLSPKR